MRWLTRSQGTHWWAPLAQRGAMAGGPERRQAQALPLMSSMNLEKSHMLSEALRALACSLSLKEPQ